LHRVQNKSGVERYSVSPSETFSSSPSFPSDAPPSLLTLSFSYSSSSSPHLPLTSLPLTSTRHQIPFFLDGNSDILVAPTRGPGLGKYPAVTVEQHLRTKFDASYYDKSTADIMKSVVKAPGA
jgi:isopenicillin N synthase-like dioxygenase